MQNTSDITAADAVAALAGKVVNDETTVGKSGKTLLWSGFSVILLAVVNAIIGNPALFSWHSGVIVVVANVVLVFLKNVVDSTVPNV